MTLVGLLASQAAAVGLGDARTAVVELRGVVAPKCALSAPSERPEKFDRRRHVVEFSVGISCNEAFRYRVASFYGGLLNESAVAGPGGPDGVKYRVDVAFSGVGGRHKASMRSEAIVKVNEDDSVVWREVSEPIFDGKAQFRITLDSVSKSGFDLRDEIDAGVYRDVITITVEPRT